LYTLRTEEFGLSTKRRTYGLPRPITS